MIGKFLKLASNLIFILNKGLDNHDERAKLLLNSAQEQRQHWSWIMTTVMGFSIVLISGIWAYLLPDYIKSLYAADYSPVRITIGACLTSVIVFTWRWYTRYLDNQIACTYSDSVYSEATLNMSPEFGITGYLIRYNKRLNPIFSIPKGLSPIQKSRAIKFLVRNKRIGDRGHLIFDSISLILIGLMLIGSVTAILLAANNDHTNWYNRFIGGDWFNWIYWIGFITMFCCLGAMIFLIIYYQKKPREIDVQNAFSHMNLINI